MSLKLPYLEYGIEELSCDSCFESDIICKEIVVLCKECALKLMNLIKENNLKFDFNCNEVE